MKKILLITLLYTSIFAEAKVYMGLGYGLYNETYTNSAAGLPDTTDNAARIKFGYGARDAYAVEFSIDYIEHASYDTNPVIGKSKYGFNIALMKSFDFDIYINPFIRLGFGAGMIDNYENNNPSLSYGSYDVGTGFFIPINEYSDIEFAYEYKYLSYEKENTLDSTISNTSNVNIFYLGYNIRF